MATSMIRIFKTPLMFLVFFCAAFLMADLEGGRVFAIDASGNGSVYLTEFVTPLTAISQAGFSISSGEFIKYASEPGDVGGTVRMYKNSNWEQFVVDGSWIRRREDTSWAPQGDVHCNIPGEPRAVYTLTSDAPPGDNSQVPGSAGWLPVSVNFTAFTASLDSSTMSIVPIDMSKVASSNGAQRIQCSLKENIGAYPATGQSQTMGLTYHTAGSFTFCSGEKNATDLVDILVTNGFGVGDHFYFMKGWGFVGFQDPTGRNAGLGSGGGCAGGGGFSPGPGGSEVPPACPSGSMQLKIKGTIKSSGDFAVQTNELTGETVYINRKNIPENQWANYSFINNQPIKGAIVAIYPSYAFSGADPFGNTHEYSPGKVGGKLYSTSENFVRTKSDGNFEIVATKTGTEVCDLGGWKQYLAIICPEKVGGIVKTTVRDLYAFPLNRANGEVVLGDINVSCDIDLSKNGNPRPPTSLEYVARDPNKFLACSDWGISPGDKKVSKTVKWDYNVLIQDSHSTSKSFPFNLGDWLTTLLPADIRARLPFKGVKEGFLGTQQVSCDVRSMFSSVIGFYGGIKADSAQLPNYYGFSSKPPGTQTYNNFEEKTPLPLCSEVRDCSSAISFDGKKNNIQTCGGMANNLRAPYDGTIIDATGTTIRNTTGYSERFRLTNKNMEVCRDSLSESSPRRTLVEIAPPEGICGDLDSNGIVDQLAGELPCPDNPKCGDLNDNDIFDPGETVCQGGGLTYKFDSRYFPYDVVYTGTTEPLAYKMQTRTNNYLDSVSSPGVGKHNRVIPFGPAEGTRPDNQGDGQRFPEGYQESKWPASPDASQDKAYGMSGDSWTGKQYSASMVLAAPVEFTGTPDENSIRKATAELTDSVKFDSTATFYKIGLLDSLCTCSLIEDASANKNGTLVEKCIDATGTTANKQNVKILQPLGKFSEASDWNYNGKDPRYPDNQDSIHTLQPGFKYAGDARQGFEVQGGAQNKITYYQQPLGDQNFTPFWVEAAEIIKCAFAGDEKTNDVVTGAKAGCGRTLPIVTKNKTFGPWLPDFSRLKSAFISIMALNEPFETPVATTSTCQVDAAVTKAQTPEDRQGQGQDLTFNVNTDLAVTYATNSVSSPTFGGFTSQCTMISGWNVKEYPNQGLFAADCLDNGSTCWVTGSFGHENWSGTNTFIAKSTDSGSSWSVSNPVGPFVHGLGLDGTLKLANGQSGFLYNLLGSGTSGIRGRSGTAFNSYTAFLYDVAGGLGGYVAGGTSFAFYSQNGTTWDVLNKKDDKSAFCQANPYSCADRVGCESIYWPAGCTPYNYDAANPNCDNNSATPLPQCCCEGVSAAGDADGDPRTPNCTGCWKWGEGSIWGVDCNKDGDCIMAGQAAPYSWKARKSEVSACILSNPLDPLDCITGVWWRDKADMSSTSAGCSGSGRVGSCQAWSVAYPGTDVAYVSLGGRADVYDGRTDPAKGTGDGGGAINKSVDGGRTWQQQAIPAGLVTSLRGLDCFSETDCVAVGTNGVILRTTNGTSWEEYWKDNQDIKDAKNAKVQFLGVAYPNKNTVIAVGYIPKSDGSVEKGVIYTLGEKEVCTETPEPEPEPAPPLTPGPPSTPLPPGSCPHTLQIDRCACDGMTVQDPGRDGVTIIGDLGFEIKGIGSTTGTSCYTWVNRWHGEPWSTSCSLAPGTYRCHLWGSYGPGVCNTNIERDLTCP